MGIRDSLSKLITYGAIKIQENSPTLYFVGGFGLLGLGIVEACKATLKAEEVLCQIETEKEEELAGYNETIERAIEEAPKRGREYTKEQIERDRYVARVKTWAHAAGKCIVRFGKLYAKPAILIGLGVFGILRSHNILTSRLTSAVATCSLISNQFDAYREAVIQEYGDDADKKLRLAKIAKIAAENTTGGSEGNGNINMRIGNTDVARYYIGAEKETANDAINRIICVRNMAEEILISRGYITLNEVYRALQIPETDAGLTLGWSVKHNKDGVGRIDFGVNGLNHTNNWRREWEDEYDHYHRILLDFNVDGNIYGTVG